MGRRDGFGERSRGHVGLEHVKGEFATQRLLEVKQEMQACKRVSARFFPGLIFITGRR